MIQDYLSTFSKGQSVSGGSAVPSSRYYDLKDLRDIAQGTPWVLTLAMVALAHALEYPVVVTLEQDDNADFSSPTALQTLATFKTTDGAGTLHNVTVQDGIITEEFLRLKYTPTGGSITGATFDAFTAARANAVNQGHYYPSAVEIN